MFRKVFFNALFAFFVSSLNVCSMHAMDMKDLATFMQGMQGMDRQSFETLMRSTQTQDVEYPQWLQSSTSYSRFPGYCYNQPHPESQLVSEEVSRETLQVNAHLWPENVDLINYACALYVTQAVLVPRPVTSWTLEDIQKINGLLIDINLVPESSLKRSGFLRNKLIFFTKLKQDDRNYSVAQVLLLRLLLKAPNCETYEEFKRKITPQEVSNLERYFTVCRYAPAEVEQQMREFIKNLHAKAAHESRSSLALAIFAHNQLLHIQGFNDGIGRTARVIGFSILLKQGIIPYTMRDSDMYSRIVAGLEKGPTLDHYLRAMIFLTLMSPFSKRFDLNGIPLDKPLDAAEIETIQSMFNSFSVRDPHAKDCIIKLRNYVHKRLNIFMKDCQNCGKEAALACSRCGFVKYCGTQCQKQNWSRHKLACANIKEAIDKYGKK